MKSIKIALFFFVTSTPVSVCAAVVDGVQKAGKIQATSWR
jgi:hypothetical protein